MFYTPHAALELEDGRSAAHRRRLEPAGVLLVQLAPRLLVAPRRFYSLDKKRGKVTLEWQFEDPYSANGGTSVAGVQNAGDGEDDDSRDGGLASARVAAVDGWRQ